MKNVCKHSYTDIVCTRSMHFIRVVIFAGCFLFYLNFPKEKGLAAQ